MSMKIGIASAPLLTMATRGRPITFNHLYSSAKWRRVRTLQLLHSPLCVLCLKRGITTPATICDHITPHAGDVNEFWLGPFQSLCGQCHNSAKKFEENRGYLPDIGLDGFPVDPRHPANAPRRV
jgi:5-methylcytosine-specific restriction enzyme A